MSQAAVFRRVDLLSGIAMMLVCGAGDPRAFVVTGPQHVTPARAQAERKAPASVWRVQIADPVRANLMRKILDEASRWFADAECRTLLTEFHDERDRSLAERLAGLQVDTHTYLSLVVFAEDLGDRACARGALFVTKAGSRVVHVCGLLLEQSWRQNQRHVVAAIVHEILHTLGLGENPPASSYITERVLMRCKQSEHGRGR
jgi:hypothetical protein